MLPPLDSLKLSVLVPNGGDAGCDCIRRARQNFEEYRDLPLGLLCLFNAWDVFKASRHNDLKEWDKGNKIWHIYFRDSPFRTLRLEPVPGAEGTVNVFSHGIFLRSFEKKLDCPQQWQAMLRCLWEYGHQRQIARSIPQLNPLRLNALKQHSANDYNDDEDRYQLMRHSSHLLETKYMSMGVYELLVAFDFCKPQLSVDRSSAFLEDTGYEIWQILFYDSLFRAVQVNSGIAEGAVEVFRPDKGARIFQMTDGPSTWQALLKYIWDYGNDLHVDGKKPKAARTSATYQAQARSKQRRVEKPLLHRVLRQLNSKAQHETTGKTKRLRAILEEDDNALDEAHVRHPLQRQALQVRIANGQVGIVSRPKDMIDVPGKEHHQTSGDSGAVTDADSHRDDTNSSLDARGVP